MGSHYLYEVPILSDEGALGIPAAIQRFLHGGKKNKKDGRMGIS